MNKLIPVRIDPPITEHSEFKVMWLNKNEEVARPSHYLITREQLEQVITEGYYAASDGRTMADILKELGIDEPTDKLSPEYLEQFKQAQADNPNLHLYFGGEEDE